MSAISVLVSQTVTTYPCCACSIYSRKSHIDYPTRTSSYSIQGNLDRSSIYHRWSNHTCNTRTRHGGRLLAQHKWSLSNCKTRTRPSSLTLVSDIHPLAQCCHEFLSWKKVACFLVAILFQHLTCVLIQLISLSLITCCSWYRVMLNCFGAAQRCAASRRR